MAPLSLETPLSQRDSPLSGSLWRRSNLPLSPTELGNALRARDSSGPQYNPGQGTVYPTSINNNGIFALFGLLGAGLVLASIWFFFWARNGGFVFRKGDWEDYKSTVLRRKGPNGTALSGATRSTVLGGGSIVGSQGSMQEFVNDEKAFSEHAGGGRKKREKKNKNSQDVDVRAYRHEKAAKVGGLNRDADGSYHDTTNTTRSTYTGASRPIRKVSQQQDEPRTPRKPPGRQFSYKLGSEATFSVASDDSHRPLRASPNHNRHSNSSTPVSTPRHSRQHSPTKRYSETPTRNDRYSSRTRMPGNYAEPLDFDSRYEESATEQMRNTKTYFHPIAGLGRSSAGFRRGGGGRNDDLGDSDGETGTARS